MLQGCATGCMHGGTLRLILLVLPLQVFDGQPLQLMAKDMATGDTMFHLTLWHRRMLQHAANQSQGVAAAGAGAVNTSG